MIGSALKKLAARENLRVDHGVAYGSLRGFAATMYDGAGTKTLLFSTVFPDEQKFCLLQAELNGRNLQKEFRVLKCELCGDGVVTVFHDNPGTMKKIDAFLDWFIPRLEAADATRVSICTECRCEITQGSWHLVGGAAHHLHDACAEGLKRKFKMETETKKENDTGSYISGLAGALIGALVGAAVWALVLYLGYIAGVVGLLIGWLADKGYLLLGGRQGKGRVPILIIAIVFGVLLGTFGGETLSVAMAIRSGEIVGFTYSDIPYIFSVVLRDGEYVGLLAKNIGIGLLLAGLCVFTLVRRAATEVSETKMVRLR